MTNDVNGVTQGGLPKITDVASGRKVASDQPSAGASQSRESASKDTVELTDGARLLERVESQLAATPDVDVTRVDAVKEAVNSGNYSIDDRAIADKILRSDRERG